VAEFAVVDWAIACCELNAVTANEKAASANRETTVFIMLFLPTESTRGSPKSERRQTDEGVADSMAGSHEWNAQDMHPSIPCEFYL
jgi:hypothetical protein